MQIHIHNIYTSNSHITLTHTVSPEASYWAVCAFVNLSPYLRHTNILHFHMPTSVQMSMLYDVIRLCVGINTPNIPSDSVPTCPHLPTHSYLATYLTLPTQPYLPTYLPTHPNLTQPNLTLPYLPTYPNPT